jgi:predicted aspartyl protease
MVIRRVAGASVGFIHVTVSVKPLTGRGPNYEASFLVDTGALDCLVPGSALRGIGIEPEGVNTYELADGSLRDYEFAYARLELLGSSAVSRILFGPETAAPLLGVLVLEAAGITIDPASHRLHKMPALRL